MRYESLSAMCRRLTAKKAARDREQEKSRGGEQIPLTEFFAVSPVHGNFNPECPSCKY